MVALLRVVARTVAFALLLALAILGLAIAVFAIQGDSRALSLPTLAQHLHLPGLRERIGEFLDRLETPGPVAWVSVAGGAGAMLTGLLLLVGALAPRRERLVVLAEEGGATLAARPRPLARVADARLEQLRGVTDAHASVRPARRHGAGSLSAVASHSQRFASSEIEQRSTAALASLAAAFGLELRVRARAGTGSARVE